MGICLGGIEAVDEVWKTCCALHNWLLEIDGLDGEWDGSIGLHDARDVVRHLPFALQRLREGCDLRLFDTSGLGPGDDRINQQVTMEVINNNDANASALPANDRTVRYLSLNNFRSKLIDHFDILFKRNRLVWPQRLPAP